MSKNADYAAQYAEYAQAQMARYGIPASVTLAQAILESSNGQSELSRKGNNHFGIKATNAWLSQGGEYLVYTDDKPNERFCKYASVADSYEHHSQFLKNNSRYAACFQLDPSDYKGWTEAIAKAGYATGGDYAQKLQRIIEANGLDKYDKEVLEAHIEQPVAQSVEKPLEKEKTVEAQSVPEDKCRDLASSADPIIEMVMALFASLMRLAQQIDTKRTAVDLTTLVGGMKSCALEMNANGKPALYAHNGITKVAHELTPAELSRLSATLNNPNLSDDAKRMRVAGLVNGIVLSQQASQNFDLAMSEAQNQTLKR